MCGMGLGPFLGVYLQGKNWTPDEIGYVMTVGGLAGMLLTTPLGALADGTRKKRSMLAVVTGMIVLSVMMIFRCHFFPVVAGAQIVQGIMAAAVAPLLTSITLGLVGQKGLAHRLGQNEAWNHFGNFSTAVPGGLAGYYYGIPGVFGVMLVMGLCSVVFVFMINPGLIDYDTARGLEKEKNAVPIPAGSLLANSAIIVTGLILFFFDLGNAALLPLLGQSAVASFKVDPAVYTAATVVIAQLTMIPMALLAAKLAEKRGHGAGLLRFALLALPARGLVAGFWHDPWSIVPVQILDGVGAGLDRCGNTRYRGENPAWNRACQYGTGNCHDPSGNRCSVEQYRRRSVCISCRIWRCISGIDGIGMLCAGTVSGCRQMVAAFRNRTGELILLYRNVP